MSVANTLEAGTAAFVRAIAGSSLTPIDVVRGDVSTMEGRSRLVCRFRLSRTKTVHFEDPIMVKEATPITNEPENMSDDMLGTLNIEELAMALEFAKDQEKQAKNYRLKVEDVILDHPEVIKERKAEGTSNVGRIKIATGYTRGWDQEVLNGKEKDVSPNFWPFDLVWKEDKKKSKVLLDLFPEMMASVNEALTLTPSKPTITVKAVSDD